VHISYQLFTLSWSLLFSHNFNTEVCGLLAACADCYVLGAIHANDWLLAYGQGITILYCLPCLAK